MDDDTFQRLAIIGLAVVIVGVIVIMKTQVALINTANQNCNQVVDLIFEQCQEEGNITIQTIKGRNTQLEYDRGVCVIK